MSVMEGTIHRHWAFKNRNPELLPPPGPLAEHLDATLALSAMRHNMTLKKPEGHFHSSWTMIEYALSHQTPLDDEMRLKYIDDASALLGGILARSSITSEAIYVGALTLIAYLPLMKKRAVNHTLEREDCLRLYQDLGSVLEQIMTYQSEHRVTWELGELLFDAAAARTLQPDLLVYPSSPREESHSTQRVNHDRYFIMDKEKAPVQIKLRATDKEYDHPIVTTIVMPLLINAMDTAGYTGCYTDAERIHIATAAIVAEADQTQLTRRQQILLDRFSRSVAARCRFNAAFIPVQHTA